MFLICLTFYLLVNLFNNTISVFFLPALHILWLYDFKKKVYTSKIYVLLGSCLLIMLLFQMPVFENDYYRYFLDGTHYLKGMPAYDWAPKDSTIVISGEVPMEAVGYPEEKTVYPPILLVFFAGLVFLSFEQLFLFCWLLKLFAFLCLAPLLYFLFIKQKHPEPTQTTAMALLNPLVFFEVFRNLHFEFLTAFGLLCFFYCRGGFAFLGYVFSTSLRMLYAPAFLFAFSLKSFRHHVLGGLAGLIFVWAVPLFFLSGELSQFSRNLNWIRLNWEMNSGLFRWCRQVAYNFSLDGLFAIEASYLFCGSLVLIFAVFLWRWRHITLFEKMTLLGMFGPLVSPVVNPWYFVPSALLIHFVRPQIQVSLFLFLGFLSFYYLFFLIPGQLDGPPGVWLEIEHFLLWSCLVHALWTLGLRPGARTKT